MNLKVLKRKQLVWLLEPRHHLRPKAMHQQRKAVLLAAVERGLKSPHYASGLRREIGKMVLGVEL
jgi:hypothetical protein